MRQLDLDSIAERLVVLPGVSPCAVVAVGVRIGASWRFAAGAAGQRSANHPGHVDPETPFDLASVTKPFVASTAARLVKRGAIHWESKLEDVVPELADTASASAPLVDLLSHRAGLEDHRALYLPLLRGASVDPVEALRTTANARRPECEGTRPGDGFAPLYSDLGYLLAGTVLTRAAGKPLAELVDAEVARPLGLDVGAACWWLERESDFRARVAPTEVVEFRGGEIIGEVHDENAWALSGLGMSGHAGLFGRARGVLKFGACVLDALGGRRDDWLGRGDVEPLVRVRPGGTLRAGFDGRAETGSTAGSRFGPRTFGHLGFTGTSLWCDPDEELVSVILTNRVNPTRNNIAIRAVRPALGDALFEAGRALRQGAKPSL
jgi:CubicO group peptidase (beta-lactamase class C family)